MRESKFIYWNLNELEKFQRTVLISLFSVVLIFIMIYTETFPSEVTFILSLLLIITCVIQLVYTYIKYKKSYN
ncbi:hypothetical protein [Alkalibacillus haloalkaliphilus]|uniref:hypothetical protein n=1 Tax=Alkalibacillus haloalkaliphilus TaxID=94136 RepID=UPI002935814B|nr:hypothetical protein [Alkalibacillus haloalkaliphilus]MDV2581541.1 hypothetical protein [Alkalibacillus haloalkaliphilus]